MFTVSDQTKDQGNKMRHPEDYYRKFMSRFDEDEYLLKARKYLKIAGVQLVYACMLLFYAYKHPDTPSWARRMVLGALAYALAPIDLIPDLAPFLGFTDDFGVLMFGVVSIACYIDDSVREKAQKHVIKWFGRVDQDDFDEVNRKIG